MSDVPSTLRILVVEDEAHLRNALIKIFHYFGHDARGVEDGSAMDAALAEQPADIIILDVNLPGEDGLRIAQRLRRTSACGIIMLTGRGQIDEKLDGYQSGADLYFVKPVDPVELHAAIVSLGRRLVPAELAAWQLDAKRSVLLTPRGIEVPLSAQKCTFLKLLFANPGDTVPRSEIYAVLGHADDEYARQRVETMITRLRSDVRSSDPESELPVRARHNLGYAFLADNVR